MDIVTTLATLLATFIIVGLAVMMYFDVPLKPGASGPQGKLPGPATRPLR